MTSVRRRLGFLGLGVVLTLGVLVPPADGAGANAYGLAYARAMYNPAGVAPLYPAGAVAATDGYWYVADSGGNRVDRIDPTTGTISTVLATGLDRPRDIAFDATSSTLWVADTTANQIEEVSLAGSVLHTFGTGATTYLKSPFGVSVDASGVYVADSYNNGIKKIDKATGTVIWMQTSCLGALSRPRDVTVGDDGNIYAVDTDHNRVVVLQANNGTCLNAFGSAGKAAGQFQSPRSIAPDGTGGVWVVEAANTRLQHLTANGVSIGMTSVTAGDGPAQFRQPSCVFVAGAQVVGCDVYRLLRFNVNGSGVPVYATSIVGAAPAPGGFNEPFGVAYNGSNQLVVTDMFNHRVQLFDANEGFVRQWGSYGSVKNHFIFPRGVAFDAAGNVVVTNSENNRIEVFNPGGTLLSTVKPKTPPPLQWPYQTVPVADGSFWSADTNRNRVVRLAADGTVLGSFTGGGTLRTPRGIAMDSTGSLYVSNTPNNRVEKYDQAGNLLGVIATPGNGANQVRGPWNLAVSSASGSELLYIADSINGRVVVLTLSGAAVTSFGSPGSGAGQFKAPWSVAVSAVDGRVAVADSGNSRISIWTPA